MYEEVAKRSDPQKSVYELFCECVSPEEAKHLSRYLKEYCRGEENSYPFLHGLLSVTQLRLSVNLPTAVAEKVAEPLDEFKATLQNFLNELKNNQTFRKQENALRKSFWDWPLREQYNNKLAIWLQARMEQFEGLIAYRARWVMLILGLIVSAFFLRVAHAAHLELGRVESQLESEVSTRQQLKNERDAQDAALKEAEDAKEAAVAKASELQDQYLASIEQKSTELANAKLHRLEPSSYQLAQEIQRGSRRVKLQDGSFAWEIKIHEAPNSPFMYVAALRDPARTVVLYAKDQEGRIDLSATAPEVISIERTQHKGKSQQK